MKKYKDLIKLLLSFIIFFFASYLLVIFIKYGLKIDISNIEYHGLAIIQLILSFLSTVLYTLLYFDVIKSSFNNLSKNGKRLTHFISAVVIGFIALYVTQIIANYLENILFFLAGIERDIVENQRLVDELLGSAPIITIISACLLGPIEEELLFRGAIGQVLKNKKVFITVSGLIFGLVHVTDSIMLIGELILLGIVIDFILSNNKINNHKKKMLSVISTVLILLIFACLYYFEFGNLIHVITNLDMVEVIGGLTYVLMGIVISSLYVYNDRNILINIGIHASSNIMVVIIALCLK